MDVSVQWSSLKIIFNVSLSFLVHASEIESFFFNALFFVFCF